MISQNINITNNISNKAYCNANVTNSINLMSNILSGYTGLKANDTMFSNDYDYINMSNKVLDNIGLEKNNNMSDSQSLREFNLASGSVHKGMKWSYSYGTWYLQDSLGANVFSFKVGANGDVGDMCVLTSGHGIVVTSPDGLTKKRIGIGNDGNLLLTSV